MVNVRQSSSERFIAGQMGCVVQRSDVYQFPDFVDDIDIYLDGILEVRPALDDTMSGCLDLAEILYDPIFYQCIQKQIDSDLMIRNRYVFRDHFSVYVHSEDSHRKADPFDVSACQDHTFRHFKQLKL